MLAGEHNPAVDLAQVVVMLRPQLLRPVAGAAERERHTMPGDRNAVFELFVVLRMDARAQRDSARHALRRRHRCEFVGACTFDYIGA